MRIVSSHIFGSILLAACCPWAVRELRVMGQVTTEGFSYWRVLIGSTDGGDGAFGVVAILTAILGASLPLAPITYTSRRYIAVTFATVGTFFHALYGTPLFRGTGFWGQWSPGLGFWAIAALFIAAGTAALRQKEEAKK